MQVWTISNQKGGVGKTTTTVALGGIAAEKGQRVLLVDLEEGHPAITTQLNPQIKITKIKK